MTVFYKKVGRRYVEVSESTDAPFDAFPIGATLVIKQKNVTMRRYNVEPALAPMVAAATLAREAISNALYEASKLRPTTTPITEAQRSAWKKLARAFGNELATLSAGSAVDCAEAGCRALMDEADKILSHPVVRAAYDDFLVVAKLCHQAEKS